MFTIDPLFCSRIGALHALPASHTPLRLTAIRPSHSATLISQNGFIVMVEKMAALLISTSTWPNAFSASSTICLHDASLETSVVQKIALAPESVTSASTLRPLSALTSASTTRHPSSRNRRADARALPSAVADADNVLTGHPF